MKSKTSIISVMCAAVAATGVFAFSACGDARVRTEYILSYVTVDSHVYSSTSEVVQAVADSVVEIRTESIKTQWGMQYIVSSAGSGVIVGHKKDYSKYFIATNNHVIDGASHIQVCLRSGETYDAELVAADERGDIAVVSIVEEQTLNVAVWGDSDDLRIGDDLIAIGNPLGSLGGTVTKGILSATERSISVENNTMMLLQTDTAINPGNSGGGLFNMRGELIGVVNAKTSDEQVEGICFAIPANTARAIFDDLMTYGVVQGRVSLGIKVAESTNNNILYVIDAGNSPANTFKQYDRIYSINGIEIKSLLTYNDAVASLKPGDEAEIIVYRGTLQQSVSPIFGTSQTLKFDVNPTTFTVTAKQKEA